MLLSVECLRGRLGCVFYNRLLIFIFCEKDTGGGLAGGETRHRRASSVERQKGEALCALCSVQAHTATQNAGAQEPQEPKVTRAAKYHKRAAGGAITGACGRQLRLYAYKSPDPH